MLKINGYNGLFVSMDDHELISDDYNYAQVCSSRGFKPYKTAS